MGILRLYFALSVLLGHIDSEYLLSPIYAVNGFYIISGFYMSMILNEKYDKPDLNLLFYWLNYEKNGQPEMFHVYEIKFYKNWNFWAFPQFDIFAYFFHF